MTVSNLTSRDTLPSSHEELWSFATIFRNDWSGEVRIERNFKTNVLSAKSAAEQRYSLISEPIYSIDCSFLATGAEECSSLLALAQRQTLARQLVPLISDVTFTTAEVSSGASVIPVDGLDLLRIHAGKRVLVLIAGTGPLYNFSDTKIYTVDSVSAPNITISGTAGSTIPSGSLVFPLIEADTNFSPAGSFVTDSVLRLQVSASETVGPTQIGGRVSQGTIPAGMQSHDGLPIFKPDADWAGEIQFGYSRPFQSSPSGISQETEAYGSRGMMTCSLDIAATSREEAFEVIDFFDSRAGKTFPFWFIPPFSEISSWTGVTAGTSLTFSSRLREVDLEQRPYLYLELVSGILIVEATYSDNGDGTFTATFSDIGSSPSSAQILKVGTAYLSRFDQEAMIEEWSTTEVMSSRLSVREVEEEKSITIADLSDPTTSALLSRFEACPSDPPIELGIYFVDEISDGGSGSLYRLRHIDPDTDALTIIDELYLADPVDLFPYIRVHYFPHYDNKAIYVIGNVRRITTDVDNFEILRYGYYGWTAIGSNTNDLVVPLNGTAPSRIQHLYTIPDDSEPAGHQLRCVVRHIGTGFGEVSFKIYVYRPTTDLWEEAPESLGNSILIDHSHGDDIQNIQKFPNGSTPYVLMSLASVADGSLIDLTSNPAVVRKSGEQCGSILPPKNETGDIDDGGLVAVGGFDLESGSPGAQPDGIAGYLGFIAGSHVWEGRAGGYWQNEADSGSFRLMDIDYWAPFYKALLWQNNFFVVGQVAGLAAFNKPTNVAAIVTPDGKPSSLPCCLPNVITSVDGLTEGGYEWKWLKTRELDSSQNDEFQQFRDCCVYNGTLYAGGTINRIRSLSVNCRNIAKMPTCTDYSTPWEVVIPNSEPVFTFWSMVAYHPDSSLVANTDDDW